MAVLLGCFVLAAPIEYGAQNGGYGVAGMENLAVPDSNTVTIVPPPALPNLCPVSVVASHLSDGSLVRTGAGQFQIGHDPDHPQTANRPRTSSAEGVGQRLHLKLTSPDKRTIDSATVNLRGWTATGRAEKLGRTPADNDPALKMQTLTVYLKPGADRSASVDVWAPGLTSVVSVELVSVKFFDGSTWTAPQNKSCRVAPDLFMAVSQ